MYLMDSIVKNIGGPFVGAFGASIVPMFTDTYSRSDPSTRAALIRLLSTWQGVFTDQALAQCAAFVTQMERPAPPPPAPSHPLHTHPALSQPPVAPLTTAAPPFGHTDPALAALLVAWPALAQHAASLQQLMQSGMLSPAMLQQLLASASAGAGPAPADPLSLFAGLRGAPAALPPAQPLTALAAAHPASLPAHSSVAPHHSHVNHQPHAHPHPHPHPQPHPHPHPPPHPHAAPPAARAPIAAPAPQPHAPAHSADAAIARRPHEPLVRSLYGDIPVQCTQCGLRFPDREKIRDHLDMHWKNNRRTQAKKVFSRPWYLSTEEWARTASSEGTAKATSSSAIFGEAAGAGTAPPPTPAMVATKTSDEVDASEAPANAKCGVCGDAFEKYYSDERDSWLLRGSVRHPSNYAMLVHRDCLPEELLAKHALPLAAEPAAKRTRADS